MLLGSDTMRGIIQKFIPEDLVHQPGAFFRPGLYRRQESSPACPAARPWWDSRAEDVYGIAEVIRRQRGGAAVVLGALSARAPAMPRSSCISPAMSISWSPPTPSAWG